MPCSAKRGKPQGKSGGRREFSGLVGAHRTAQSFRGSLRLPVISTPACAAHRNDTVVGTALSVTAFAVTQRVKKASQSLPPAGGKGILIIFCRGVYLTENTTQAASVRLVRCKRTRRARSRLQSFCQKRAKPFFDSLSHGIRRDRLPADNPVAALTCHLSCHSLPRLRFAYPQRESQGRFVPCAKQQFICIFHPFRTQNEPPFRAAHLRFLGDYLYISGFSMVSTGRNWEVPREAFRASPATHAT
mgnify:CR=1 FL=1